MTLTLAPDSIAHLYQQQRDLFRSLHPHSAQLAAQAHAHWCNGVPMHWMGDWPTPFPLFLDQAQGARLRDVDGHEYVDFCLGDTGAMFGHSPAPVAAAIAEQAQRGLTTMLPSAAVLEVGQELSRRFGLPYWQITMTATDANRAVIRWARAITQRPYILVFNGCYHGTVDDAMVRLQDGQTISRPGLLGQVYDLAQGTKVVEFNDLAALEAALKPGDVAAVLTEPVLTNCGMVLPDAGFHRALRDLTRRSGTLLIIDETHTISSGPGGYTQAFGLEPDFFTLGKPIAGGLPCAIYGCTAELAAAMPLARQHAGSGHSGMGTTLSANPLAVAAMRANLSAVMTTEAYQYMHTLAQQLAHGLREVLAAHQLPWSVTQIGARCEFQFCAQPPRTGREAEAAMQHELEQTIHLFLLNRGLLITPFHNMTLVCPATTAADVARLIEGLDACCHALRGQ